MLGVALLAGSAAGASKGGSVDLVAYSTPKDAYGKIIAAFQKTSAGNGTSVNQSYGASGDQRQRMALARALAVEPSVLLLDEPFGALDARVRKELRAWLRRLHDEVHVTAIIVTHDQEEAMEVAGQIVVLNEGRGRAGRLAARALRAADQ